MATEIEATIFDYTLLCDNDRKLMLRRQLPDAELQAFRVDGQEYLLEQLCHQASAGAGARTQR